MWKSAASVCWRYDPYIRHNHSDAFYAADNRPRISRRRQLSLLSDLSCDFVMSVITQSPDDPKKRDYAIMPSDGQHLMNAQPINIDDLLEQCMGNRQFCISLLDDFAHTVDARVGQFEDQLKQGNLESLARLFHSLNGVTAFIAANALWDVGTRIESACDDSDFASVLALWPQLLGEIRRLVNYIPRICYQG
jgi:HPt (histidine-containing phosphotransfer) domain-containing protein